MVVVVGFWLAFSFLLPFLLLAIRCAVYFRQLFRFLAKNRIWIHVVYYVKVPDLNLWTHRSNSRKVAVRSRLRPLPFRDVDPLDAKRYCWKHNVMMYVEIVRLILVVIDFQMRYLIFNLCSQQQIVFSEYL